ncbi:unnamed protein product [Auanema sp. JU1783]|nr:unnamed protein product [Auanema sp. JU1783]
MRTLARYGCFILVVSLVFLLSSLGNRKCDEVKKDVPYWSDKPNIGIRPDNRNEACDMYKCFNFTKCSNDSYKIHVLPNEDGQIISPAYSKILSALKQSTLHTEDPNEACIFVLSIDTTDRDRISENYIPDLDALIANLPAELWNDGRNFVVFNLYHGTFPDYSDHNLGFDTGKAIIARASPSVQRFRYGFDVSFPLFHGVHDLRSNIEREIDFEPLDSLLVSFKGKRYVYGIGSETRDALHHLHNGDTIAMITTCKHNNDWKEHQDSRCELDNLEYDKWDYVSTMTNSTFCLAPRGRRLGSFRFLEALKIGCIPVVLSDDWVLPFAEVIDWSEAALVIAEENVLLVTDLLYSIPPERIISMKQMCHYLYNRYFKDVESIAVTTMEIILDRVRLAHREELSHRTFPLSRKNLDHGVTLIIRAADRQSAKLQHLVSSITNSITVRNICILWPDVRGVPPHGADFGLAIPTQFFGRNEIVKCFTQKGLTSTYILFADEIVDLKTVSLDRMKYYMENFPERVIGLHGLNVNFEKTELTFSTTYNALYPSVIGFHRSYLEAIISIPKDFINECPSVAINIAISEKSLKPPILLRGQHNENEMNIRDEAECWKKATERWKKPSIFYSDLLYN